MNTKSITRIFNILLSCVFILLTLIAIKYNSKRVIEIIATLITMTTGMVSFVINNFLKKGKKQSFNTLMDQLFNSRITLIILVFAISILLYLFTDASVKVIVRIKNLESFNADTSYSPDFSTSDSVPLELERLSAKDGMARFKIKQPFPTDTIHHIIFSGDSIKAKDDEIEIELNHAIKLREIFFGYSPPPLELQDDPVKITVFSTPWPPDTIFIETIPDKKSRKGTLKSIIQFQNSKKVEFNALYKDTIIITIKKKDYDVFTDTLLALDTLHTINAELSSRNSPQSKTISFTINRISYKKPPWKNYRTLSLPANTSIKLCINGLEREIVRPKNSNRFTIKYIPGKFTYSLWVEYKSESNLLFCGTVSETIYNKTRISVDTLRLEVCELKDGNPVFNCNQ